MKVTPKHRNSHLVEYTGKELKVCFMSDLHWDNPKCNRELLKQHLDRCLEENRYVQINGDMFCLMQGKYDPRRSKRDIRPEHNKVNYIDAVIQDAVEWFAPYKDILLHIGYGNHETAILKNLETDPLQRFVDLFNYTHKVNVALGGYGGWITFRIQGWESSGRKASVTAYHFHGSGGGGPVTKGTIQNQRQMATIEGADMILMGHVHELYTMVHSTKYLLADKYVPTHREVHHFRTGCYKDEYGDGYGGWHIERGAPPKPLGCIAVDLVFQDMNAQKVGDKINIIPTTWTS